MWLILTWINLVGALVTVYCLLMDAKRYVIAKRMGFYLFLSLSAMLLLCCTQIYQLVTVREAWGNWKLKLPVTFFWLKTLYLAWAIRFASMKKYKPSEDKKKYDELFK
jgi:hypothetical protein